MKKAIISIISIVSILISSFSVSAAEVPRESAPCDATNEAIVIVDNFIGDILAEFNARTRIYQSVKPDFNPDVEYIKDPLARDIPSVDNSLFILAKKLILESR